MKFTVGNHTFFENPTNPPRNSSQCSDNVTHASRSNRNRIPDLARYFIGCNTLGALGGSQSQKSARWFRIAKNESAIAPNRTSFLQFQARKTIPIHPLYKPAAKRASTMACEPQTETYANGIYSCAAGFGSSSSKN